MFPPIVGLFLFLLTVGLVGSGFVLAIVGRVKRRPGGARTGLALAGIAAAGYGVLWVVGLLTATPRIIQQGDEAHFCGVDCHLHVSVVTVERGSDVGVTLRFRSDARGADELPSLLTYRVVDESGRRYAPSQGWLGAPVAAGQTIDQELRFSVPETTRRPRLEISYDNVMDYLMAGQANPLAQRRNQLEL